jgi:3-deoxy-7-phosphoheptulonate synthase
VTKALEVIEGAGTPRRVVIDASHGNSQKDYRRQPVAALAVAEQVAGGEGAIAGVMLESFLVAGRQEPGDPAGLVYGQSVTDACMDFSATESVLETLAAAVHLRRRRQRAVR